MGIWWTRASTEGRGGAARRRPTRLLVSLTLIGSALPVFLPGAPARAHDTCTTPVSATVRGKQVDFDQCYDSSFTHNGTGYRVHVYYTEQNTTANQGRCTTAEGTGRCEHAISNNDDANGNNVNAVATADEAANALRFYLDRNLSPLPADGTEMNIYVAEDPRGGGVIYPNSLYWDDEWVDSNDILFKRLLAYHEEMHLVQDKFDNGGVGWRGWYGEGIARAIEDRVVPSLDTDTGHLFIPEVNGHLQTDAERTGDFMTLDYRSVLWWTWMMDHYRAPSDTDPVIGWDAMRDFFVELNTETAELNAVQDFLTSYGSSWARDFVDYSLALYAYKYSPADERLRFLDTEITGPATTGLQGHNVITSGPSFGTVSPTMAQRSSRYYEFNPASQCDYTSFTFDGRGREYAYSVLTVDGGVLDSRATSRGLTWARTVRTADLDRIVGVVTSIDQSGLVDVGRGCVTPTVSIERPTTAAVAKVGTAENPRKFIVRVAVRNGSVPVAGLVKDAFTVSLRPTSGGEFVNADILSSAYVQDDYWLVARAPNAASGGQTGEFFDLRVRLGSDDDTEASSVLYEEQTLDSVIVLDRSGSMADFNKISAARNAARLFVNELRTTDQAGYVAFDHDAYLRRQLQALDTVAARAAIRNAIAAETPGGATSIGDGMRAAADEEDARGLPENTCSFILLSDGHENANELWSAVRGDVVDNDCQMHVIALGAGANEVLMQEIAASVPSAGGSYDYADVATGVPVGSSALSTIPSGGPTLTWQNNLGRVYDYKATQAAGRQRIYSAVDPARKGLRGTLDFEDLGENSEYGVGDTFETNGAVLEGKAFFFSDGKPTEQGSATVDERQLAGGSGLDVGLNNINLSFDFGGTPSDLSLLFGDYGGNVNLEVNGELRNVADLFDLDGRFIGGVRVEVIDRGQGLGLLSLDGRVSSFAIGGQELWIDDLTFGRGVHAFFVDDTSDLLVLSASWQNPDKTRDVRLIDPEGNEVSTSFRRTDPAGTNDVWEVPDPLPGEWVVKTEGIDQQHYIAASARSHYELHAFAGTPVRALRQAIDVPLIAVFAGPERMLTKAFVRAVVTDPAGDRRIVPMYDDGAHGDSEPNDGVYGGLYRGTALGDRIQTNPDAVVDGAEPDVQGSYQVAVKAILNEITREAQTSFAIKSVKDRDHDRIADTWERDHRLNRKRARDARADPDRDKVINLCEFRLGTDPRNSDSDGGGEADGSEVRFVKRGCPVPRRDPTDPDDDRVAPLSSVLTEAEARRKRPFLRTSIGDPFEGRLVTVDIFRTVQDRSGDVVERRTKVADDFKASDFVDRDVRHGFRYRYEVVPLILGEGRKPRIGRSLFTQRIIAERDPYAPGGSILIENGDPITTSRFVTLNLSADDVGPETDGDPLRRRFGSDVRDLETRISNSLNFGKTRWRPFRATVREWDLGEGLEFGEVATVYVQFRDEAGNVGSEGFAHSASIQYARK
ncbi:MAG: VWA domain-containing protein [Actinomycetota bacterium]|nr:VWA domain-containing protein [Actinomycetota bacterium]